MEEISDAWRSIMRDEKKHYCMILSLLRKYDPIKRIKIILVIN